MKVTRKEIKECEYDNGKEMVLFIDYNHRGEKWEVQIRDYGHLVDDEQAYEYILKELRVQVRNTYNAEKMRA